MAMQYSPQLPGVHECPYPHYAQLRAENPIHWSDAAQAWVLTRYADVVAVLHDLRFSNAARLQFAFAALPDEGRQQLQAVSRSMTRVLAYLDPPAHTRMRRLMNVAFRPQLAEAMRLRIQAIVDSLLDRVEDAGQMDVVRDLAYPLPIMVSAALLGLPSADHPRLAAWADDFWAQAENRTLTTSAARQRTEQGIVDLSSYFERVIAERRALPGDDVISSLIAAEEQGNHLSELELISACITLMLGGHLNIRYLIGTGLLVLLAHPDELARLRENPALMPAAIEELLRFDGVAQVLWRVPTEDVELDGRRIRKGQRVLLMLASANRDSSQFAEPDRLDFDRRGGRAISFGIGVHFCPGTSLTFAIAEIAFSTVLRRLPGLQLAGVSPRWIDDTAARGLISLPVRFTPGV